MAATRVQRYWTVGSDCGEQKHRFVMLDESGERRKSLWVTNKTEAIQDALAELMLMLPEGVKLRIVTEGLRSLAGVLVQVATSLVIEIWQVNPSMLDHYRKLEGQPRKDDDIDAYYLALMCHRGMKGCRLAVDARPEERVLCRLTRLHTQLVNQKTQVIARFRSRLLELSPEIVADSWAGPVYKGKGMRAVLTRWPGFEGLEKARISTIEKLLRSATRYGSKCEEMAKAMKEMAKDIMMSGAERKVVTMELQASLMMIDAIEPSLAEVDKEIEAEVSRHPVGSKLIEMPGAGPFTAAVDVGEILPLARNVSEGKAATYAGLTPLSRASGKKEGPSRLARGVNKQAARSNYLSAIAAVKCSALDKAYYNKQRDRHRGHPVAHVKAGISLARQRFKVKYKLMTTDARYDKEILIESHLDRQKQGKQGSGTSA
jgi:transposase